MGTSKIWCFEILFNSLRRALGNSKCSITWEQIAKSNSLSLNGRVYPSVWTIFTRFGMFFFLICSIALLEISVAVSLPANFLVLRSERMFPSPAPTSTTLSRLKPEASSIILSTFPIAPIFLHSSELSEYCSSYLFCRLFLISI